MESLKTKILNGQFSHLINIIEKVNLIEEKNGCQLCAHFARLNLIVSVPFDFATFDDDDYDGGGCDGSWWVMATPIIDA